MSLNQRKQAQTMPKNKKSKTAKPVKTTKPTTTPSGGHEIEFNDEAKGHPRYTALRIADEVRTALPAILAKSKSSSSSGHVISVAPHGAKVIAVSMLTDAEANELVRAVNAKLRAPVLRLPTLADLQARGKPKPTPLRKRHAVPEPMLVPSWMLPPTQAPAVTLKPAKPVRTRDRKTKHHEPAHPEANTESVQVQISVMHNGKTHEIKQLPHVTIETLTARHQLAVEGDKNNGTLDLVYAVTDGFGVKHYSESLNEIVENVLDMHVFSLKSGQPSPAMLRLHVADARPTPMYSVPVDVVALLTTVSYVISESGARAFTTSSPSWRVLPLSTRKAIFLNPRKHIETIPVWVVLPASQLSRVLRADMTLVNNESLRRTLDWALEHGDYYTDVEDIVSGALTAFASKL